MGIKNLNPFIEKKAPSAFATSPLTDLRGERIAIDCYYWIFIYWQTAYNEVAKNTDFSYEEVNRAAVISLWISRLQKAIKKMKYYGAELHFVFDGKTPSAKKETQEKRKEQQRKTNERFQDAKRQVEEQPLDDDLRLQATRLAGRGTHPFGSELKIFKEILIAAGERLYEANGEGEKLCAALVHAEVATVVLSCDTDTLVYGCPKVIRKIKDKVFEETKLFEILESLELTQTTFIDLCIMAGCDYNTNIPKLGVSRAYQWLKKLGTIEAVLKKLKLPGDELKYQRCRELFTKPTVEQEIRLEIKREPDLERLANLAQQHGFYLNDLGHFS